MPRLADLTSTPVETPQTGRWFLPRVPLAFLAAALPLILFNLRRGRGQFDQQFFHEPTIRQFVSQWPRPNLGNYDSATAPGYHLFMAAVARVAGDGVVGLKLVSAMFSVMFLLLLERAVRARALSASRVVSNPPADALPLEGGIAAVLLAPLLCSMYFLLPGIWLQPDNAGWLGVLIVMLIALRPKWDALSAVSYTHLTLPTNREV